MKRIVVVICYCFWSFIYIVNCSQKQSGITQEKMFTLAYLSLKTQIDYFECPALKLASGQSVGDSIGDARLDGGGKFNADNQSYRDIVRGKLTLNERFLLMEMELKELPDSLAANGSLTNKELPADEWSFRITDTEGKIYKLGVFRNLKDTTSQWSLLDQRVVILQNGTELSECDKSKKTKTSFSFQCERSALKEAKSLEELNWNGYSYHQENGVQIKDCL
jgi:hypothetical protein